MREDLTREFPQAARAVTVTWARMRARRPVLWSEPVVWAAISGIGAGLIASQVGQFLMGLAFHALNPFVRNFGIATLSPLVTITGTAAGAAVALSVGGPIALGLDVAFLALGVALRIPGLAMFCERAGGGFGLPDPGICTAAGFVGSLWPQVVGIGLGLAFARGITTRGPGVNSLLRIAGAYAIALFVVSQVWANAVAQTANPNALTSGLMFSSAVVTAAAAAGAVAAQLPRSIRNALILAGVSLLPWLTLQLPLALQSLVPTPPAEHVGFILVSIVTQPIASAALVLSATVAARSRFVPREPA
jgi:hypothetical protein